MSLFWHATAALVTLGPVVEETVEVAGTVVDTALDVDVLVEGGADVLAAGPELHPPATSPARTTAVPTTPALMLVPARRSSAPKRQCKWDISSSD
jgi:hypothetical protein